MTLKNIFALIALLTLPLCASAQNEKSNEMLSKDLGNKIEAIDADIKAIKAHKKAEPDNAEWDAQLISKQEELKKVKNQKKIIDDAIKAEKTSIKETMQAENAQKKYDKVRQQADNIRKQTRAQGKSNEYLKDELATKIELCNLDIKNLKEHKKLEPGDATLPIKIKQKQAELKELKRQKKIIEAELKTSKVAEQAADKADKAQQKHEAAKDKADDLRKGLNKDTKKETTTEEVKTPIVDIPPTEEVKTPVVVDLRADEVE